QSLSVSSDCSQPFPPLWSQSPKPGLHVSTPQLPVSQLGNAFGTSLQGTPQPPQFCSVFVCVSQSSCLPSQSPQPSSHVPTTHAPFLQAGAAWSILHT